MNAVANAVAEEIRVGDEVVLTKEHRVSRRLRLKPGKKGTVRSTHRDSKDTFVVFNVPKLPNVCASCESSFSLSQNGATGEVVCKASGCDYEHGFEDITLTIPLADLKLLSVHKSERDKTDWQNKLRIALFEEQSAIQKVETLRAEGRAKGWV